MTSGERILDTVLSIIGGATGAFFGYHIFFWLLGQGFYGMMIPGAMLGLGCGLLARQRSQLRGVVCGVLALGLAVFTEWKAFPFAKDDSLMYLVSHLTDKTPIKLLMIALGVVFAYWLGKDGSLERIVPGTTPPLKNL